MSKLSQELQILFYLYNKKQNGKFIKINDILSDLDLEEMSARQVRRYINDLNLAGFYIETKRGSEGGYRIQDGVDLSLIFNSHVLLMIKIAMKNNSKINNLFSNLNNSFVTNCIDGDNNLLDDTLDKLEILINAIQNKKKIIFKYKEYEKKINVCPYKILYTNHTYYLIGENNGKLKTYDIIFINKISLTNNFEEKVELINKLSLIVNNYGIKICENQKQYKLRVRCENNFVLNEFTKYFENKGKIYGLEYEVVANSENEIFYPLFRISPKNYVFLDEKIKMAYKRYLKQYINILEEK